MSQFVGSFVHNISRNDRGFTDCGPCPCGEEFFCSIHQQHASACPCPPVEEWKASPYVLPKHLDVAHTLRGEGFDELLRTVRAGWLPNSVLVVGEEGDEGYLLEARQKLDGRATAYVCRRGVCRTPVTDPAELAALL